MSSIGPQLPPQATKRKRSSEPEEPLSPSKAARPSQNADEIDLAGSSDDDYGPRAPTTAGPTMPPALEASVEATSSTNKDEINLDSDSDSDSDTGPAPPTAAATGPQQPPASPSASSSDDDDDDYGPALPGSAPRRGPIGPSLPSQTSDAPTRDDWMLAPPTSTGYSERDTTKMKARKFASKPSASAGGSSGELSSIWTETPEEKLRRLQDSVLGRTSGASGSAEHAGATAKSKQEEERNRKIAASIESQRGQSLYESHQQQKKDSRQDKPGVHDSDEEDDPSKRAFDREKDMALGSKIGSAQRRDLVNKSANLGGRFSKGSFL